MIICSQCGNTVKDGLRFCTECGTPVLTGAARQPPPPTQPYPPYSPPPPPPAWQAPVQLPNYVPVPTPTPSPVVPVRSTSPAVWIVIPVGLLIILVIVIFGIKSSDSNTNTSSSYNSDVTSASPSPSIDNRPLVTCKFNGVHVRDAPNLTAFIITDINMGQAVRVIRESTNRDTVRIKSLNQDVNDNWSEIQVENSSVRGWVFSGFLR